MKSAEKEEVFRQRLLETFKVEAEEHIKGIIKGLNLIENALAEGEGVEVDVIEPIFRQFHSLKGAAQATGFEEVGQICQNAENIMSLWKKTPGLANRPQALELLDMARDSARKLGIKVPEANDTSSLPASLPSQPASTLPRFITDLSQLNAYIQGARAETDPSVPEAQTTSASSSPASPSASSQRPSSASTPTASNETIRIASDKLDSLLRRGEQLVLAKLNSQLRWSEAQELLNMSLALQNDDDIKKLTPSVLSHQDRGRRLTSALQRHVRNLSADYHELNNQLRALLDEVKSARLAPVRPLLEELELSAHRLARRLGKKVAITTEGWELELDRNIMEQLKDPLIHLVRNALDHGLEKASERLSAHKSEEGHLLIKVCSRGTGNMDFIVRDDGRGIQTEEVLEAARRQGLIAAGAPADSLDLIFSSGISTRLQANEISGRGLGMAIVRENVEKLKGAIRVQTKVGEGTTFILSVPTSLATFEGLMLRENNRLMVVPLSAVEAVAHLAQKDIHSVEGSHVIEFRGSLTPISRLGKMLGIPSPASDIANQKLSAVILNVGARQAAFMVDEILGVNEVLSRDLGPQLKRVRYISGACLTGYQQVVPVLNATDLVAHVRNSSSHNIPDANPAFTPTVLVADDSITTRTLLRSLLESSNFNVKVAQDGSAAWSMLQEEDFDLLISDIDMPGITGLALTQKVRSHPIMHSLPIILVTGQESAEERQNGISCGADDYILKSQFDEGVLIKAIERLIGPSDRSRQS